MKKVLITMAVLTSMVAGVMVFSSFAASKQETENKSVQIEVEAPIYWEGSAVSCGRDTNHYIGIKVYQTEGQCNSFYAVVTSSEYESNIGKELWVRENPSYNAKWPSCSQSKYYVSCGDYYYFNM